MRLLLAALAVLATAGALAAGWATGRPPAPPLTVTRVAGDRPLQALPNPNEAPAASLDAFAQALGSSPPPKNTGEEGAPSKPAPPPEPDVASIFRRQLTAVVAERPDGPLAVLLADEGPARMLKPGQMFMAGWKLQSVTMNQAVLGRGRERKTIALFDPSAPSPAAPAGSRPAATPPQDASGPPLAHNGVGGTREELA